MTEEVNVGLGAPAPKKGMSKGCLVGIIIAVFLVLLVAAFFLIAIFYKTEIVKFGTSMSLNSSKQMLAESDVSGIDTVAYNKIIDEFNMKLEADTMELDEVSDSIRFVDISNVFSLTQFVMEDKTIDSAEVEKLILALVNKYPDLVPESPDSLELEMIDSLQTE